MDPPLGVGHDRIPQLFLSFGCIKFFLFYILNLLK